MNEWKLELIAWIDVETTGLDPAQDLLLEIALIVTTANLHELGRESLVIAHSRDAIDVAFERNAERDPEGAAFVRGMHTDNGLIAECCGDWAVSMSEADERLAHLLGVHAGQFESVRFPLGGSSTGLDREMVKRHLPRLSSLLHHRTVDASCMKIALVNWAGVEPKRSQQRKELHRALQDIEDSIKLARRMKLHLQRARKAELVPA